MGVRQHAAHEGPALAEHDVVAREVVAAVQLLVGLVGLRRLAALLVVRVRVVGGLVVQRLRLLRVRRLWLLLVLAARGHAARGGRERETRLVRTPLARLLSQSLFLSLPLLEFANVLFRRVSSAPRQARALYYANYTHLRNGPK